MDHVAGVLGTGGGGLGAGVLGRGGGGSRGGQDGGGSWVTVVDGDI